MNNNKTTINSGVGFTGALQIALIVLKLLGKINWSWFWVLAPAWISFIIFILVLLIVIFILK